MKTCSMPGCDRPHRARGLCRQHHAELIADPSNRLVEKNRAMVLAALPARQAAIIEKTGLISCTVKRILEELRADGRMHISHFIPPVRSGDKFWPVYEAGPGEDAVLTKQARKSHALSTCRRGYHQRKAKSAGATWASALFFGGQQKTKTASRKVA